MDVYQAIFLGIVEGLTEFIPVSSTGHLILVGELINFSGAHSATFDIAIQLGAILAVVVLYRDFFMDLFRPRNWLGTDMKNIVIAIFPALVLGFFFHSRIKSMFSSEFVLVGLAVGAIAMIIVEKFMKQQISHRRNHFLTAYIETPPDHDLTLFHPSTDSTDTKKHSVTGHFIIWNI